MMNFSLFCHVSSSESCNILAFKSFFFNSIENLHFRKFVILPIFFVGQLSLGPYKMRASTACLHRRQKESYETEINVEYWILYLKLISTSEG